MSDANSTETVQFASPQLIGAPHSSQNFAPARRALPQLRQLLLAGAPQLSQNLAPGRNGWPHWLQFEADALPFTVPATPGAMLIGGGTAPGPIGGRPALGGGAIGGGVKLEPATAPEA